MGISQESKQAKRFSIPMVADPQFMAHTRPFSKTPRERIGRSPAEKWSRWLILASSLLIICTPFLGFITAITGVYIIGFFASLLGLRLPALGFMGTTLLCALDPMARVYIFSAVGLPWNTFNYWLLFAAIIRIKSIVKIRSPILMLWCAFLLLIIVQLYHSTNWLLGSQHILYGMSVFGLLAYFDRVKNSEQVITWTAFSTGIVSFLAGLFFFQQGNNIPPINLNAWCYFPLTAVISSSLAIVVEKHSRNQVIALATIISLNTTLIFLAGSRGSLLLASFCILFFVKRVASEKRVIFWSALAIIAGVWVAGLFPKTKLHSIERIERLFSDEYTLKTKTSGRSDIAKAGWLLFLNRPFGVGTGGFQEGLNSSVLYEKVPMHILSRGLQAHSAWIQVLSENGLIGIILFTCFIVSFAALGKKSKNRSQKEIGLLTSILLGAAFLSTEFQPKGLWWLAAGATLMITDKWSAIANHAKSKKST